MFEKGDLVTYGCKGVCEVKNITTLNLEGIPKDRLYYEMQSMVNAGSRIFSPVGQEEKNAMRAVLTKEEAEELWDSCRSADCAGRRMKDGERKPTAGLSITAMQEECSV